MLSRTFLRILFNNIFYDNIISKTVRTLINFCYEFNIFSNNELKNNNNLPLNENDTRKNLFFQSVAGDKIDCL